jgi:hypothetical protein
MNTNFKDMKKIIALISILTFVLFSCKEDEIIVDPVFEFVSFKGNPSINLNEFTNSEEGYPLVVQLWAFTPYTEDITVTLAITSTNAASGIDFIVDPLTSVKIKAGKLVSDTVFIFTVDNAAGTDLERKFDVKIASVSKPDIKIGLGPESQKNKAISFTIVDDECSSTSVIFNGSLDNSLSWGYDGHAEDEWNETGVGLSATGVLNGNKITIAGDLLYYDGFIPGNVSLVLTLAPISPGATKGKATFGTLDLGVATDGYTYRLLEIGEGTFDVCSKIITTKFDFQYDDGGTWVHYYYVENIFSVVECTETISVLNGSLVNSLSWGYDGHVVGEWNEAGVALTATATLAGNIVTVKGDLIYYDGFIPGNITLPLTLTPYNPGGTKGKATFGTLDLGVATDTYTYRLLEIGEGTYDVCGKSVKTKFDLQWDDGGTWTHYYYVECVLSVP